MIQIKDISWFPICSFSTVDSLSTVVVHPQTKYVWIKTSHCERLHFLWDFEKKERFASWFLVMETPTMLISKFCDKKFMVLRWNDYLKQTWNLFILKTLEVKRSTYRKSSLRVGATPQFFQQINNNYKNVFLPSKIISCRILRVCKIL